MKTLSIVCLLGLASAAAAVPEIRSYRIHEGNEDVVLVPLEQYRALLPAASDAKAETAPLVDRVTSCEVHVTCEAGWARVVLRGMLQLGVHSAAPAAPTTAATTSSPSVAGPRLMPLLPASALVLTASTLPGTLVSETDGYHLLTSDVGDKSFQIDGFLPIKTEGSRPTLKLVLPLAPRQNIRVSIAGGTDLEVTTTGSTIAKQSLRGEWTDLELCGTGQSTTTLSWEPASRAEERASYARSSVESKPEFSSLVLTAVTGTRDVLRARSRVLVQVRKNLVKELRLSLPEGCTLVDVSSSADTRAVQEWEEEKSPARGVLLRLTGTKQDQLDLLVDYEMRVTARGRFVPVSVPAAYHEQHEIGFIAPSNVLLDVQAGEGWKTIDTASCTKDFQKLVGDSLSRSFQAEVFPASDRGTGLHAIDVSMQTLKQESLILATVDLAEAETIVTKEGHVIGRIMYHVKNSTQQFLKVRLQPGQRLLTLFVGTHAVRAAQSEADTVLVPLARSGQSATGASPFTVSITYHQLLDPLGSAPKIDIALPKIDLNISTLRWEVGVPEGWQLRPAGGNMRTEAEYRPVVFAGDQAAAGSAEETALFQDATLPLKVPLPRGSATYHFSRDLIESEAQEPPYIVVQVSQTAPTMVLRALAFIIGLVLFYMILRHRADTRSRWIVTGLGLGGSSIVVATVQLATPTIGIVLHVALGIFTGILMFGMTRLIRLEDCPD